MKTAFFDCFAGIAGDMALAALLDCGVPLDELKRGLSSLPVSGWDIEAEDVLRGGIHAKNVRVTLNGISDEEELQAATAHQAGHHHHHEHKHHAHEHHHEHAHHHAHEHTHNHEYDHTHEHSHHEHSHHHHHGHDHDYSHPHHHGRSMAEIRDIINASELSPRVRETSLKIFERIAVAEAYLHHSTPEEIHFHEIGGVDSLIDICGVVWCLEYLGVEEVHCSALPHSTGFVDCAHGRMPVPAPATLEILKGAKWIPTEIVGELVTPTGAGIVAALSQSFGAMPELSIEKIGIGSGKKTLADRPNLLRVAIGESVNKKATLKGLKAETLQVLECNIDDMNPELYDGVIAQLFERGALDVWLQPIQMKKNRPGVVLGVLCETEKRDAILQTLLRETTTLGVRESQVLRHSLPRSFDEIETQFGTVKVKTVQWPQGSVRRATPEYSDVARLARENNVPAREIYEAAVAAIASKDNVK